jgi:transcriptional regulatory protein LevR
MHTLIIGEPGVGKTLMAEEIWRYMDQNQTPGAQPKPFVVFNCAEYYENPQLLLSQLFGYEKGAFTGAEATKRGLVEEADGGVLFLDEIHRLPAIGQEMLFTLIDRGLFRRLGGTADLTAHLMIIGATTESPEAAFLQTFRRRIPMLIRIPALGERPVGECIDLIYHFLSEEAKRLMIPIRISPHALRLLVSYQGEGNIGGLRKEIQLCCARGYLEYRNAQQLGDAQPAIEFHSRNLSRQAQSAPVPENVERYLESWVKRRSLVVDLGEPPAGPIPTSMATAAPGHVQPGAGPTRHAHGAGSPGRGLDPAAPHMVPADGDVDLYDFIESRAAHYADEHIAPYEIGQLVSLDLQRHISTPAGSPGAEKNPDSPELDIFDSVSLGVMAAANEFVRLASNEFHCPYPDVICFTLARYLQQIMFQEKAGQASSGPGIRQLVGELDEKLQFVKKMTPFLDNALRITLTDDEATIIALLLDNKSKLDTKNHVGLVVMCHGNTTATSIADFTNQVLLTKLVRAVDMPISSSSEAVYDTLCLAVRQSDEGRGVIVLTDSDNFEYYERRLAETTGIPCRVIPGLNTLMALEICKGILTTDEGFNRIADRCISNYRSYVHSLFDRIGFVEIGEETREEGKGVIIVSCITGGGSARRIREWLLQFQSVFMNTDIMPIGLKDDILELAERLGKRLKLVIGFIDPQISGVPFVSMEKVTSQEGINRIIMILNGWSNQGLETQLTQEELPLHIRFDQIAKRLKYFAPSIDSAMAAKQADYVLRAIGGGATTGIPADLQVRMYIHIVTMFERLKTQGPMPMPDDKDGIMSRKPRQFERITRILETACKGLGLTLQPSEAYYFMLTIPEGTCVSQ